MINDATKLQTSMKIASNKGENMMFLPSDYLFCMRKGVYWVVFLAVVFVAICRNAVC